MESGNGVTKFIASVLMMSLSACFSSAVVKDELVYWVEYNEREYYVFEYPSESYGDQRTYYEVWAGHFGSEEDALATGIIAIEMASGCVVARNTVSISGGRVRASTHCV